MNLHMSAIKESDFQNIQLALQQKDPFLAEKVLKISGSYNIQGPNLPLGAPFLRTFTRSSNIPADLAQEILKALQAFHKLRMDRQTAWGCVWCRRGNALLCNVFLCEVAAVKKLGRKS